jgi:hypothetical protein
MFNWILLTLKVMSGAWGAYFTLWLPDLILGILRLVFLIAIALEFTSMRNKDWLRAALKKFKKSVLISRTYLMDVFSTIFKRDGTSINFFKRLTLF